MSQGSASFNILSNQVTFGDTPNFDAFNRLRTADPFSVFDSKTIADNKPLIWDDQQTSGTASSTFNTNQASVTLAVDNTTGTRVRQTFQRFPYQPGKSQLILMTGVLGAGVTNVTKRLGYFDSSNGFFFEQSGSTLRVVRRTNTSGTPADNQVDQSSWNLDKLDGTGSSGITLDVTKAQIFIIDFQWLGVGRIRMGFDINGLIIYCHQFIIANNLTTVSISNPNLPLRYELSSSANATASLVCICSSVLSEGSRDLKGSYFSADRGATSLTTGDDTSVYPLVAIRTQANYDFAFISLDKISIISTSSCDYRWAIILNPTVTGVAFSFSAITNSAIEADAARVNTSTLSGGTTLISGYQSATSDTIINNPVEFNIGTSISGTKDVIVLAVQRLTGTAETFYGSIGWKESS